MCLVALEQHCVPGPICPRRRAGRESEISLGAASFLVACITTAYIKAAGKNKALEVTAFLDSRLFINALGSRRLWIVWLVNVHRFQLLVQQDYLTQIGVGAPVSYDDVIVSIVVEVARELCDPISGVGYGRFKGDRDPITLVDRIAVDATH